VWVSGCARTENARQFGLRDKAGGGPAARVRPFPLLQPLSLTLRSSRLATEQVRSNENRDGGGRLAVGAAAVVVVAPPKRRPPSSSSATTAAAAAAALARVRRGVGDVEIPGSAGLGAPLTAAGGVAVSDSRAARRR
jgi:hypothetical protein